MPGSCKLTETQFLCLVLNNMEGGTINLEKVAEEAGMPTGKAAWVKLHRLKKANAVSADGEAGASSPEKEATAAAEGTPKKARKSPAKDAGSAKKRKLQEAAQETKPVVKAEAEGEGED